MDKIKYKGEYALLLDTADLLPERMSVPVNYQELMKKLKVKKVIVITTLPFHLLPLSLRDLINLNEQAICFRGGID